MSAEEQSQGGLGKSIVLFVLGLFVLYYGIKVMQGRNDHEAHDETHQADHHVEEAVSSPETASSPARTKSSGVDVAALMADNAKLKQEVADLQAELYQSQQKLGAVRKLLQAEAFSSQE